MSSSINNPVSGGDTPASSKTGDFAISASGKFDNDGAVGTITGTVANVSGLVAHVARVNAFEVRILPPSGKSIIWSGGVMTVDEYFRLTDFGCIQLWVNAAGNVVIEDPGNVQEQNP